MTTRYIRKLEKELDCRVMLVASTWRDDIAFDLDETAARRFIDLFDALPHDGEVAVVLWSRGGHVGFADWVVRVLRAKAERVVAVVPTLINGAASMIALSADEIVLHPYGAVGAYDVGPIQYAAPRIDRGNYDDIPALGGLQYDHDPDMPARIAVAANAQRRARQWLDRNRHMDVAGLTLDELGPDTGLSARQLEAAGFNTSTLDSDALWKLQMAVEYELGVRGEPLVLYSESDLSGEEMEFEPAFGIPCALLETTKRRFVYERDSGRPDPDTGELVGAWSD